uniref:E3 ubiquitin-protein ligase n=1 Tax=Caenorhabditis tropicalis TaxID=1561998 RepID=A0A1I7UEZ3_9PELO
MADNRRNMTRRQLVGYVWFRDQLEYYRAVNNHWHNDFRGGPEMVEVERLLLCIMLVGREERSNRGIGQIEAWQRELIPAVLRLQEAMRG